MAKRHYSNWLKTFLEYGSFSETPLNILFWTGVSTVAGALRRRVWIDMRKFQWVPNFYIVIVAPPGVVGKSSSIDLGTSLLRRVPDVKFGPDVITWQALITSLAESTQGVVDPETGEIHSMSCLTCAAREFGNLFNPQDREMVDIFVSLWDGSLGPFAKATKHSGSDNVVNPWVNIIACTTPSWIAQNFPEYMIGGGFTSRCVFLYADEKAKLVAYPDEEAPPEYYDMQAKLLEDLVAISNLFGEYQIAKDARAWGREWYANHWANPSPGLNPEQFGGYIARKQTHIHKLALILAASQRDEPVVLLEDLLAAENMISVLEKDAHQVFNRMGQTPITRGSGQILDLLNRSGGKMTETALFRELFRTMSYQDFLLAKSSVLSAGYVTQVQEGSEVYLRANRELKNVSAA